MSGDASIIDAQRNAMNSATVHLVMNHARNFSLVNILALDSAERFVLLSVVCVIKMSSLSLYSTAMKKMKMPGN